MTHFFYLITTLAFFESVTTTPQIDFYLLQLIYHKSTYNYIYIKMCVNGEDLTVRSYYIGTLLNLRLK